jgi:hypothetical protein
VTIGGRSELAIEVLSGATVMRPSLAAPWCASLLRVTRALLMASVALSSTVALGQTEDEPPSAPAEQVEAVPAAPPVTPAPSPPPEEAGPETASPSAPTEIPSSERPGSGVPAPAPVLPRTDAPTTPAPTSTRPVAGPAPAAQTRKGGSAAKREAPRPAATLTIVNGRAVQATAVAVLAGSKVVARSGPLASNARVTLKLPKLKQCRVSVVAKLPLWYSALRSGAVNVCKAGQALVRL